MSTILDSLLLLPPPPFPQTQEALHVAYLSPLTAAFKAIRNPHSSTASILQIVQQLPAYPGRLTTPRAQQFSECEALLGGLYALSAYVCAKESIEVDGPGGVDVRIILCASEDARPIPENLEVQPLAGPLIDLPTLSWTRRNWRYVFAVDGEAGQALLARYQQLVGLTRPPLEGQIRTLAGGISMRAGVPIPDATASKSLSSGDTHTTVAVGGTFDHLHAGHKLLLTATAFLLQPYSPTARIRRLIVGITGDELLKNKKYAEFLESWQQRQDGVVAFLRTVLYFPLPGKEVDLTVSTRDEPGPNGHAVETTLGYTLIRVEGVEIQDPFGPTITDESISALVVSGETRSGGQAVNSKRREKGFGDLDVFEVEVLDAGEPSDTIAPNGTLTTEFESKISSTAIRKHRAELAQNNQSALEPGT